MTQSKDITWLIRHPCETVTGARLPSGHDVMKNFAYYHRVLKLTISTSATKVYDQLVVFWLKSRLPIWHKPNIIQKIKDLYCQHTGLMKHRSRNNARDQKNQKEYSDKLDTLFDVSHANSIKLITNDDRQFLTLHQESTAASIGSVNMKTHLLEKRSAARKERLQQRQTAAVSMNRLNTWWHHSHLNQAFREWTWRFYGQICC